MGGTGRAALPRRSDGALPVPYPKKRTRSNDDQPEARYDDTHKMPRIHVVDSDTSNRLHLCILVERLPATTTVFR